MHWRSISIAQHCTVIIILGLNFVVNMKPLVNLETSATLYTPYKIKISTKVDLTDQKRGQIEVKPGYQLVISITPKVIDTDKNFMTFDFQTRNCKFQHETEGLNFLPNYSKAGCELECAMKIATGKSNYCFKFHHKMANAHKSADFVFFQTSGYSGALFKGHQQGQKCK